MEKKRQNTWGAIVTLLLFIFLGGITLCRKAQKEQMLETLITMEPQTVTAFKIYPRVIGPYGSPITFHAPASIIDEFLQSLKDSQAYMYNHDTVASSDHSWFIEIETNSQVLQMSCHIPFGRGTIVAGRLGKWKARSSTPYGYVQSRRLFQWFQKYKGEWLTPSSEP